MLDFSDTKHLHVEFRNEPVKIESRSKEAGRPIFRDQEVVVIKFVGDRRKELVAPAAEKFTRDRSTGRWVTYAEAFPRHYAAFRSGESALVEGTPLVVCDFLSPARVKEFEALNVTTVEQLAALEGASLERLGMNARELRNEAVRYLESAAAQAADDRRRQAEIDDGPQRVDAAKPKAGKRKD